ncbi:hypothetical protein [Actinoplanes auranticolor]|uniref:Uncharacterized protein n=1 Tax=Actinoplanes auranticolor TaxID=47988 RepID=A0A919SR73_9ACTN|nr:hypothetical protein [Actinoplanes auranticolor]GIM76936.1 hypothetical protein Aau02nite_73400 [Actinoplanes auranticolor]
MATESRAYTRDRTWRLVLTAWRTNLLFYNAIGATVHAQHWEETTVWIFFKKQDWVDKPVESIEVSATFQGVLPSTVPGAARRSDRRVNAAEADARLWSAGIGISVDAGAGSGLPDPGTAKPGIGPKLDVRSVQATANAVVNGEILRCDEVSAA